MTVQGAGGEEWRNLEGAHGNYRREHWRAVLERATDQIGRYRQRDVTLALRTRDGRPLAGQAVEIVQVEPAFIWGDCACEWQQQLEAGTPLTDHERDRRHWMRRIFNSYNILHYWNEKHWPGAPSSERVQGYLNYESLDAIVNYCLSLGAICKGHPLYWTVLKALPVWLLRYDRATQWKFLEVRVRSLVSRFRGRIKLYDAVNEMMWEPVLANIDRRHWPHIEPIGAWADDIEQVLGWARDEDPRRHLSAERIWSGDGEPHAVPRARQRWGNRRAGEPVPPHAGACPDAHPARGGARWHRAADAAGGLGLPGEL